jgi:GNAT superfamily N-acetyltransferase
MNPESEIRQATVGDAAEILALQRLAYQSEAQIYGDWTLPPLLQTLDEVLEQFRNHVFLKAVIEGLIIGSVRACMSASTCHIGRLIVHPNWQNQGIGTRLLLEAERIHPDAGRFELFTGSRSLGNLRHYRRLGYQEFRREPLSNQVVLVYLEKRSPLAALLANGVGQKNLPAL